MELGAFSLSLNVANIEKSKQFYETLGFVVSGGDISQKWLILRNGDSTTIGLFEGMFDKNMLTFNPGWNNQAKEVNPFSDVRDIQKHLMSKGIAIDSIVDESSSGPAHIALKDPDGNPILIDQHR
ncbi:VOC family protein [Agaribacter flavus]|uniref:VOC family protein n=1 Tax=Agaribacter flavus TaxID=1902781 RepID=A0ABV7FW18_9ALTE